MKYLIFLLSISLLVACGPTKKEKAQHKFNEGVKLMYRNNNVQAIKLFTEAFELDPQMEEALVYRGKVYMNGGNYAKAVEEATAAIKINPDNGEAYNTRAQARFYMDDRDGSCADWRKADELGIPNLENKIRHCP